MKSKLYYVLHAFLGLVLGILNHWFAYGLFVGAKIGELWYIWKDHSRVRVRRLTKKHRRYVEDALKYVNKKRIVVAYTIQKSWDHYSGDWEGYHLDILLEDDTKTYNAAKRVDFQQDVWEHMDGLYGDEKKKDLFFLVQTNIFHADNYKIYMNTSSYECHRVLSNANIEVEL